MHTVMAQETVTNGMKYLLQLRLYITQIRLQASYNQWIGLIREILTRNQGVFPIKIMGLPWKFSLKPIHRKNMCSEEHMASRRNVVCPETMTINCLMRNMTMNHCLTGYSIFHCGAQKQ
jgi:hypothetical protein